MNTRYWHPCPLVTAALLIASRGAAQVVPTTKATFKAAYNVTELLANSTTNYLQYLPSLTALPGNQFMVCWTTTYQISASDCIGRVFDLQGTPQTDEIHLNPNRWADWEFGPRVLPSPNGGIAVIYEDEVVPSGGGPFLQLFSPQLTPMGGEIQIGNTRSWPSAAAGPNGNFVAVYGRLDIDGVLARMYNADGQPLGLEWQVAAASPAPPGGLDPGAVAFATDGSFCITWADGANVYASLYDAGGSPLGSPILVNTSTGGARWWASIAYAGLSGYVIAWVGSGNPTPENIYARALSPSGAFLSPEWQVSQSMQGAIGIPNVAAQSTGEFFVAWSALQADYDVFGRLYDSDGRPMGRQFRVNQFTTGDQYTSPYSGRTSALLLNGTIIVAWYNSAPGDGNGIGLTILNPRFVR